MTERMRQAVIDWGRMLTALTVIGAFFSVVMAAMASWAWTIWGPGLIEQSGVATRTDIQATEERFGVRLGALSDQVSTLANTVDQQARTVAVLAQPEDIAIYRDLPRPVGGEHCVPGEICTLLIYVVRDPRAVDCRVTGAELVMTARGVEYRQPIIRTGTPNNVGITAQGIEPSFNLPLSLRGLSEVPAQIVTRYIDCPWQVDGMPPAIGVSPEFTLHLRDAE